MLAIEGSDIGVLLQPVNYGGKKGTVSLRDVA